MNSGFLALYLTQNLAPEDRLYFAFGMIFVTIIMLILIRVKK